ncbi:MAG TPA: hypothetical protein PLM93_05630 [Sulfuricurvum sp.]|jgi:hypothetical protein|nr:hypothetical protein [Campylobacterota bacterium]OYZ34060.1 MAG: hypothetical protein B7Y30_08135 [Campylobacterales bacterium 16-40-21]OZA03465.1 MAG: hypothetical protein B7X89_05585 [Sulfuricurvum sp. 17-40-25]HQS66655.1 hypothetical protein [Sulfuricurvum sp.]HQT36511.1 hypothetical protein [Sulfuricurvum sp.]
MISLTHLEAALEAVDAEVKALLYNQSMSLNEKDEKMLPLLRESKVLKQAYEDLCYLRDNPPTSTTGCKAGQYRED